MQTPVRVTPAGLLGVMLLGCAVAALFGAAPLASWAPDVPVLQQATQTWQDLTRRVGLDRPYELLRHAVRAAEAERFGGGD